MRCTELFRGKSCLASLLQFIFGCAINHVSLGGMLFNNKPRTGRAGPTSSHAGQETSKRFFRLTVWCRVWEGTYCPSRLNLPRHHFFCACRFPSPLHFQLQKERGAVPMIAQQPSRPATLPFPLRTFPHLERKFSASHDRGSTDVFSPEFSVAERARRKLELISLQRRLAQARFQELIPASLELLDRLADHRGLVIHVDPVHVWAKVETPSPWLLQEGIPWPIEVLFFECDGGVSHVIVEPLVLPLLKSLERGTQKVRNILQGLNDRQREAMLRALRRLGELKIVAFAD